MSDPKEHICSHEHMACKGDCGGTCDEHDDGEREEYGADLDHPPVQKLVDFREMGRLMRMPAPDRVQDLIDKGY
jgi:hypothetical protein